MSGDNLTKCIDCPRPVRINGGRCTACYARHRRKQRRMKTLTCFGCSEEFQSTRRDAKFCSPACRQTDYRARTGDEVAA